VSDNDECVGERLAALGHGRMLDQAHIHRGAGVERAAQQGNVLRHGLHQDQHRVHCSRLPGVASLSAIIHPMIEVKVNGASRRFAAPLDVATLLAQLEMAGKKVAVERNGEIVPKSAHARTLVADGDQLEIVVAVGGG
jgi:sulfur carrier protein